MKWLVQITGSVAALLLLAGCEREVTAPKAVPPKGDQSTTQVSAAGHAKTASPVGDWERLMEKAAANAQSKARKESARFEALKAELLLVEIADYGAAADFVRSRYQTGLQASLLETLAASLAAKGHTAQDIYAVINEFPAGMGKWISLRAVALGLPEAQFHELMKLCATSPVPEEREALADALRGRLSGADFSNYGELTRMADEWPLEVRKILQERLPAVTAAGAVSLREGIQRMGPDINQQLQFLGEYGLRHPGEVFSYVFKEIPVEAKSTSQLLLAVNDGMRDPQAVAQEIVSLQPSKIADKRTVTREFIRQWLEHDPDAASTWVRQAGAADGVILKGGAEAIVTYLQGKNEETALEVWNALLQAK